MGKIYLKKVKSISGRCINTEGKACYFRCKNLSCKPCLYYEMYIQVPKHTKQNIETVLNLLYCAFLKINKMIPLITDLNYINLNELDKSDVGLFVVRGQIAAAIKELDNDFYTTHIFKIAGLKK